MNIERILSPHYAATLNRIGTCQVVLIAQDTTQLIREKTKQEEMMKGVRATEKVFGIGRIASLVEKILQKDKQQTKCVVVCQLDQVPARDDLIARSTIGENPPPINKIYHYKSIAYHLNFAKSMAK